MKRKHVVTSAALALLLCVWFSPRPQTMAADERKGGDGDKKFVLDAASGGLTEVKLGEIAQKNAANEDVKKFGETMVAEHTAAGNELKQIAQSKHIDVPAEPNEKDGKLIDRLSQLEGEKFDKDYMKTMVRDHEKDVEEFKREAAHGQDADVKAFAIKTLPTLEHHLEMARETAGKVGAGGGADEKSKGKHQGHTGAKSDTQQ